MYHSIYRKHGQIPDAELNLLDAAREAGTEKGKLARGLAAKKGIARIQVSKDENKSTPSTQNKSGPEAARNNEPSKASSGESKLFLILLRRLGGNRGAVE